MLSYSYDPTSALGQVRVAIGDAPDDMPATLSGSARSVWKCAFADEEIAPFLITRNGAVLEAAADVCLLAASSATYLSNLIRVGDLQLDNRGLATALREQAAALLARAAAVPAEAVVESWSTPAQGREQVTRGLLATVPGWGDLVTQRILVASVAALGKAVAATFDQMGIIRYSGTTIDPITKHGTDGWVVRASGVPCLLRPDRNGPIRPDTADALMVRQPWLITFATGQPTAKDDQIVIGSRRFTVEDVLAGSWEAARQVRGVEVT